MNANFTHATLVSSAVSSGLRRRAVAAAFVAGVYVLVSVAAPWLVRYGAEIVPAVTAADSSVTAATERRCATAPEHGTACTAEDAWPD